MTPNLQPTAKQVNLANKSPLAYALVVMVILLGIMTTAYFHSNSNNRTDCKEENAALLTENRQLHETIYNILTNKTKEFKELQHNTDSVLRVALKKPQHTKSK